MDQTDLWQVVPRQEFDPWHVVPRQIFTPYDCLLISVAFCCSLSRWLLVNRCEYNQSISLDDCGQYSLREMRVDTTAVIR